MTYLASIQNVKLLRRGVLCIRYQCVLALIAFAGCASTPCIADGATPPNILVITADDLGNHLGSFGDSSVATPNLDAIAERGARFTRAYVAQPSCSSSRASFLTGLYPHQTGQLGLTHKGFAMTSNWPTLPGLLSDQLGYFTAVAGKLHVGPRAAFAFLDEWQKEDAKTWTDNAEQVAKVAASYIEKAEKKPFYIQFDLRDPHRPFARQRAGLPATVLEPGDVDLFPWTGKRAASHAEDTANYYNAISRLDSITGRLIEVLQRANRLDNTLIIFWSDNGPPFARAKTTLFEQGVRVPLIIAGPGVKGGQVLDELVSMVDVFPTVLAMSGATAPTGTAHYVGRNLVPLLRGEAIQWRRYLFTETNFHTPEQWAPARAVTNGEWTLIDYLGTGGEARHQALFKLRADPYNRRNVIDRPGHAKIKTRLQDALLAWREETDDPLLSPAVVKALEQISQNPAAAVPPWYNP